MAQALPAQVPNFVSHRTTENSAKHEQRTTSHFDQSSFGVLSLWLNVVAF
jgi:hypothetical protein